MFRRDNASTCVEASGIEGGACSNADYMATTPVSNCTFIPQQTEWYRNGKTYYDNYGPHVWIGNDDPLAMPPAVLGTYTQFDGKMGMASAVPASNSSGFFGVFSSEWKLGDLVSGLQAVQGGLEDTALWYADNTGLYLATSTGTADMMPNVALYSEVAHLNFCMRMGQPVCKHVSICMFLQHCC